MLTGIDDGMSQLVLVVFWMTNKVKKKAMNTNLTIYLYSNTVISVGEKYTFWNSSLCDCLHPLVTSEYSSQHFVLKHPKTMKSFKFSRRRVWRWLVFWVVAPCSLAIALMMEAASTSETSANFNQTTRRSNPEDSHINAIFTLKLFSVGVADHVPHI
jgi:hypothetical protein